MLDGWSPPTPSLALLVILVYATSAQDANRMLSSATAMVDLINYGRLAQGEGASICGVLMLVDWNSMRRIFWSFSPHPGQGLNLPFFPRVNCTKRLLIGRHFFYLFLVQSNKVNTRGRWHPPQASGEL